MLKQNIDCCKWEKCKRMTGTMTRKGNRVCEYD